MLIKLWDWEKKWTCTQVFEGHTHYVMQIVINPKDNNTFASASLDRTVKVGVRAQYPTLVQLCSGCTKVHYSVTTHHNFCRRFGNSVQAPPTSRWKDTRRASTA